MKSESIIIVLSYQAEGRMRNQGHKTASAEADCQCRRRGYEWQPTLTANQRHLKTNKCCYVLNTYVEVLTHNLCEFGDRTFQEVIKVK